MGRNALELACLHPDTQNCKKYSCMFLYATGEILDGDKLKDDKIPIPEYFQKLKENLDLKHLCREAIRKHMSWDFLLFSRNIYCTTTRWMRINFIGGSKEAPTFSFLCSFQDKLTKLISWCPTFEIDAPSIGEILDHPLNGIFDVRFQWRIQDFPEAGYQLSRGSANIRFC